MKATINLADVPPVNAAQLSVPMRIALDQGHGLALYKGLSEAHLRAIETALWQEFDGEPGTRLAVALRFRALHDVFAAARLKELFLANGFKLIAKAIQEASIQRLNINFGFCAQRFVMVLDRASQTAAPASKIAFRERVAA